ncbi:uncharacterized protein A1O5_07069 [Cladophialophora psammophila CBS 110553]|uniref:3CxxC-type domain-containing protein n=1 Tax=Cladophialophora psammophila CBS 110553 TaxID=1182543 RepID=W9WZ99_9EURO|nr:uncharacterized protein A1O5_07069 [Cladophialophora psammophila CBS 110553]EXJ69996.1 hypothetical protein A1O5_07069 [Cladophialophora psammophila CBS 110553]
MAKKFSRPKGKTRTSFMFPALHEDVANAVSHSIASTWFCQNNSDEGTNNIYATHVMGRFSCNNNACGNGWSSKKVAILIRGYAENGYNAEVFNQRCKTCNKLGALVLDKQSYVDRVAYRIQRWAGVQVERQNYASKRGMPHKREFCEGCKRGVCRQKDE